MANETGTSSNLVRGVKAVMEALRLEDFPMDRHDIDYAVGDIEIESGGGQYVAIRDLTESFPDASFQTPEEVMRAIHLALAKKAQPAA